jgi:elongator complex protein 3
MPGLPGATPELDLAMSRRLFEDERFRPDGLKLYPTMVVEGTELETWYREGRYVPYDDETMVGLTTAIKALVPGYVRISRVLRDIPSRFIVAGLKDSLRDVVRERMARDGLECRCIRCREYGHRARSGREISAPHLIRLDYEAAGGREVFLSYEDAGGTLFGLLRLRMPPRPLPGQVGGGSIGLVRELHVFGPEVPLNEQREAAAQHRGLGRSLLLEAEKIARVEFGAGRMFVLSGTGAREYYRALGYTLFGDYMVKSLDGEG